MSIDYYERLPQPDKHDQTNDFNNYKDKGSFMRRWGLLLSLLLSGTGSANDHQPLFESCLSLKNDTNAQAAQPCRFFIKGFMAASYLTGVPLDSRLSKDKSEFFNRAYENRLGFTRADSRQKECEVPQNPDLIITSISKNIPAKFESFNELNLMIVNALRNNQSCGPEEI